MLEDLKWEINILEKISDKYKWVYAERLVDLYNKQIRCLDRYAKDHNRLALEAIAWRVIFVGSAVCGVVGPGLGAWAPNLGTEIAGTVMMMAAFVGVPWAVFQPILVDHLGIEDMKKNIEIAKEYKQQIKEVEEKIKKMEEQNKTKGSR